MIAGTLAPSNLKYYSPVVLSIREDPQDRKHDQRCPGDQGPIWVATRQQYGFQRRNQRLRPLQCAHSPRAEFTQQPVEEKITTDSCKNSADSKARCGRNRPANSLMLQNFRGKK